MKIEVLNDFKPVLKNKRFICLWRSQILSQLTIQIINFLILIKIYEHTQSAIATSLFWIAYALPAMIVGPFAAALVDILDRKKLLMGANILQSLVVLVYALTYQKFFFLSYAVVLMYSFFNQFYVPAEAASLPIVVSKKRLPQANGIFFMTQQAAIILGFGLAGLASEFLGFRTMFLIASAMLLGAFGSISFLPKMQPKEKVSYLEIGISEFFERMAEGYHFIKDHRNVLLPFLILMGLQMALSVTVVSLPILAVRVLKIKASSSGGLIVVPAGLGAVSGTVLVSKLLKDKKHWRKKRIIEWSLISLSISLWTLSVLIPQVLPPLRIILAMILFLLIGLSFVGVLIPSQTYLQEVTPNGLMGRVWGNFWFLATVAGIIPVLFSATITDVLGVRPLFFLMGAITFLVFLVCKKKGQGLLIQAETG